jgi:hypothetical protein
VFALPILIAAGYSAVAPTEALIEFQSSRVAAEYGISSEVTRTIEARLELGNVDVSSLVGSWVATVGGLLGIVGGIAGLARSRRIRGRAVAGG